MYADTHPAVIHQLGGMGVRGRAGVLPQELSDRFFFNVFAATLSATAVFRERDHSIHMYCTFTHSNVSAY